jgi:hypothetical protein
MSEAHAGLETYRGQLTHAIARQLHDTRRARRRYARALRIGVPAAAVLGAGALAVTLTAGSQVSSADAAILRHVAAELTSRPATILHERAMVTLNGRTAPYELWAESIPPYHYHVLKWGHEGTGTTSRPSADFAEQLRALVQAGKATVDGTATVGGVAAYKLTVSGSSDRFLNGTAYVSQSDYRPLEIDTTSNGGERIVFQTYEHVPATAANLQRIRAGG